MKIKTDDVREDLVACTAGAIFIALAYVTLWLSAILG